jgi:hypothetical protein
MQHDGRVYLKSDDKIMELVVRDVGSTVIASVRVTARVLPHATRLFDGVAVQSLLGACYLSLFQRSGAHLQLRLRELDGRAVIDAKCDGAVTQLLLRDGAGYQRAWLRLASDGRYDLRLEPTSEATLLPFAALASVYVALSNDGLEVRSARPGANGARLVADAAIGGDWRLMHHAGRLLCIAGNEVAAMSLSEPASGTRARATAL